MSDQYVTDNFPTVPPRLARPMPPVAKRELSQSPLLQRLRWHGYDFKEIRRRIRVCRAHDTSEFMDSVAIPNPESFCGDWDRSGIQ